VAAWEQLQAPYAEWVASGSRSSCRAPLQRQHPSRRQQCRWGSEHSSCIHYGPQPADRT
jgi:hypothetical protein